MSAGVSFTVKFPPNAPPYLRGGRLPNNFSRPPLPASPPPRAPQPRYQQRQQQPQQQWQPQPQQQWQPQPQQQPPFQFYGSEGDQYPPSMSTRRAPGMMNRFRGGQSGGRGQGQGQGRGRGPPLRAGRAEFQQPASRPNLRPSPIRQTSYPRNRAVVSQNQQASNNYSNNGTFFYDTPQPLPQMQQQPSYGGVKQGFANSDRQRNNIARMTVDAQRRRVSQRSAVLAQRRNNIPEVAVGIEVEGITNRKDFAFIISICNLKAIERNL